MKTVLTSHLAQKVMKWVVAYRGSDVMDFAEKQGWDDVYVVGHGRMITSPMVLDNGWTLNPIEMDNSSITAEALQRIKVLNKAGITYQGLLIAHEPEDEEEGIEVERGDLFNWTWLKYAFIAAGVAILVPLVVATVAIVVALVVAAIATILAGVLIAGFMGGLGYVALYDPALLIVCEDGTIIQVFAWYS